MRLFLLLLLLIDPCHPQPPPSLLLAPCNASDPLQFFARAASRVTWQGLCVTWGSVLNTSPLQLLPCNASLRAAQAWDYAPAASSVQNPPAPARALRASACSGRARARPAAALTRPRWARAAP